MIQILRRVGLVFGVICRVASADSSVLMEIQQLGDPMAERQVFCISQEWLREDILLQSMVMRLQARLPRVTDWVPGSACFERGQEISKPLEIKMLERLVYIQQRSLPKEALSVVSSANKSEKVFQVSVDAVTKRRWDRIPPVLRATMLVTGPALLGLGVLYLLPEEMTHWHDRSSFKKFLSAYQKPPVWDRDGWFVNYVLHPWAFGSNAYLAMREQNQSMLASFLFASAQSLAWEYGLEAFTETPSIQDLLFTSTGGALLGEGFHQLTKLMQKNGFKWWEKVAVTIINPAYVIFHGYK